MASFDVEFPLTPEEALALIHFKGVMRSAVMLTAGPRQHHEAIALVFEKIERLERMRIADYTEHLKARAQNR